MDISVSQPHHVQHHHIMHQNPTGSITILLLLVNRIFLIKYQTDTKKRTPYMKNENKR